MTRVIVPYTQLHPKVDAALRLYAPQAERIQATDCDLTDPCPQPDMCPWRHLKHCHHEHCAMTYSRLLIRLWAEGEAFIVVEHDIEIHADVIPQFEVCPEPWCAFPYPGPGFQDGEAGLLKESLGCTKFSARLMDEQKDLMQTAANYDGSLRAGDWRRMDVSIIALMRERLGENATTHRHEPPVIHHHQYAYGPSCGEAECA